MDADQTIRIPPILDSWEETTRRCSSLSEEALEMIAALQKQIADHEARIQALEGAGP